MFSGPEFTSIIVDLGVSHVIWLPDSLVGRWEDALESSPVRLVRVCREGEAWPLAAGLQLGGQSPLVVMQTTGLFESGDAMRNVLFDLRVPLFAVIGARSWLVAESTDSAKRFTQPILEAWGIDYVLIDRPEKKHLLISHYRSCGEQRRAGVVLIAEGRM